MDQITTAQSQQTLSTLQGEIRLAEKERLRLLDDIDRLNKAKASEFQDAQKQLTMVRNDVKTLATKREHLELDCAVLSSSIKKSRQDLEEYGKNEINTAKKAAAAIHLASHQKLKMVEEKELSVAKRAEEVAKRETDVTVHENDVAQREKESKVIEMQLTRQTAELAERTQLEKAEVSRLEGIKNDLIPKIEELQRDEKRTREQIKISEKYAIETRQTADATLKAAIARQLTLDGQKELLDRREEKLRQKEIWLNDREATVGRAYKEVISRGGTIK
jgi:hypothetical protein